MVGTVGLAGSMMSTMGEGLSLVGNIAALTGPSGAALSTVGSILSTGGSLMTLWHSNLTNNERQGNIAKAQLFYGLTTGLISRGVGSGFRMSNSAYGVMEAGRASVDLFFTPGSTLLNHIK